MRGLLVSIVFAFLGTALLAVVLYLLMAGRDGGTYADLSLYPLAGVAEYCEHNRMGEVVRQPVNAWSSLAYAWLGLFVMATVRGSMRSEDMGLQRWHHPWLSLLLGMVLVGLGLGSFGFHASLTRLGQHVDMGFTYGVSWLVLVACVYRLGLGRWWGEEGPARKWSLGIAVLGLVLFFVFKTMLDAKVVLPVLMLSSLVGMVCLRVLEGARFRLWTLLGGSLALVLAVVFRGLDLAKVGCAPEGWVQLHALWHVCTGLAAVVCWKYISEG